MLDSVLGQLRQVVAAAESDGRPVVLACAPAIRPALRRLVALGLPRLPVLAYGEVTGTGVTDRDRGGGERWPRDCCLRVPT